MKILMTFIGAVIGGLFFDSSRFGVFVGGILFGAAIGYLGASVFELQRRLRELEAARQKPLAPPMPATAPVAVAPVPAQPVFETAPGPELEPEPEPATPVRAAPDPFQRAFDFLREFFSGEHAIPRIGVIILFFGVAFLLKYAADRSLLPIELRLAGAAVGAIILLVFGWRLRHRRAIYAIALQGGGVGLLYLTVFSALRLYSLIPPTAAFFVMVALCVFSGALAVLQNARALAILAAAGGFLAPVLVSTGGGDHVMLFSYYALLNAGIVGVAWFRAWRELNLLGFLFTFVIGVAWGVQRYRPELFASTEPFLILFFVFYVVVAVLFALRQPPALRGYVDGTIVFGVPVVGFALQAALVHRMEYGLAWSAAALGAFYILLASALWRRHTATLRLLCEAFLALGVVFATLALPLALDGRWTSAAWALEGAAIVWIGARQGRLLPRLFGSLLIVGAAVFFLMEVHRPVGAWAVLNSAFLGSLMIALAALFAARCLSRDDAGLYEQERTLAAILFGWGLIWWFGGALREIAEHVRTRGVQIDSAVAFVSLSALAAEFVGERIGWAWLRNVALGLLPAGLLLALLTLVEPHVLTPTGIGAWALFFVAHALVLKRREEFSQRHILDFLHGATLWVIALLAAHELHWVGGKIADGDVWALSAWGLAPALVAALVAVVPLPQPWQAHRRAYETTGVIAVLGAACLWLLVANLSSRGDPAPLPYVPVLNPLDLVSVFVLITVVQRAIHARGLMSSDTQRVVAVGGGALAFIWLNAALLRTLHHWGGVPFNLRAMLDSVLVQASLSIFWTSIALVVMLLATRRIMRTLWLIGAGLLAAVVVKLFLVDLDRTGTLERIVSFIVVGVLLLLIGYLAPIPRTAKGAQA